MNIAFIHDSYYSRTNAGVYAHGAFPKALWETRFLPHFNKIVVIGRKKKTNNIKQLLQSDHPRVDHVLFSNKNTIFNRLFCFSQTKKDIKNILKNIDGIVIRGPSEFGMAAARMARAQRIPYAVEMQACAFDEMWHYGSILGKIYAPLKYYRARHMVKHANQVLYVTNSFLQRRYSTKGFSTVASNVNIPTADDDVLKNRLRKIKEHTGTITFGIIGNYSNNMKGLSVLFKALSYIKNPSFLLRILGRGDPKKWREVIDNYGLTDRVIFDSPVTSRDAIFKWLDTVDIYLQPSLHEGLPRALIEAMSRGCPSLGSTAGGINELLPASWVHQKGNATILAQHINEMLDKNNQAAAAKHNINTAKRFENNILDDNRYAFYERFKTLLIHAPQPRFDQNLAH